MACSRAREHDSATLRRFLRKAAVTRDRSGERVSPFQRQEMLLLVSRGSSFPVSKKQVRFLRARNSSRSRLVGRNFSFSHERPRLATHSVIHEKDLIVQFFVVSSKT